MPPKDRKDWFQSENERIKLETTLKQLVPVADVHLEMAVLVKAITQVLDTWPDKLERDKGWNAEQLTEVQIIVDELRDILASRVMDAEDFDE